MKNCLLHFISVGMMGLLNAATWEVTSDQDHWWPTAGTLRYAVQQAADGDEIMIDPFVRKITLWQGEIIIDKNLSIKGHDVSIVGNGTCRLLSIMEKTCELEGLIFTYGYHYQEGGAIELHQGTLKLRHCIFKENYAVNWGGAIYMDTAKLYAEHTIFRDNQAGGKGGAIDAEYVFRDNQAGSDGGVIDDESVVEFKDSQFINNRAKNAGGALYTWATFLKIDNCKFMSNVSTNGGAIYNYFSDATFVGSLFLNNLALKYGGALSQIHSWTKKPLSLTHVIMRGNSAGPDEHGGAIYGHPENNIELHECTIKENYPDNIYQDQLETKVFVDERTRDLINSNENVPLQ